MRKVFFCQNEFPDGTELLRAYNAEKVYEAEGGKVQQVRTNLEKQLRRSNRGEGRSRTLDYVVLRPRGPSVKHPLMLA